VYELWNGFGPPQTGFRVLLPGEVWAFWVFVPVGWFSCANVAIIDPFTSYMGAGGGGFELAYEHGAWDELDEQFSFGGGTLRAHVQPAHTGSSTSQVVLPCDGDPYTVSLERSRTASGSWSQKQRVSELDPLSSWSRTTVITRQSSGFTRMVEGDEGLDGSVDWYTVLTLARTSPTQVVLDFEQRDDQGKLRAGFSCTFSYTEQGVAEQSTYDDDGDGQTDRTVSMIGERVGNQTSFQRAEQFTDQPALNQTAQSQITFNGPRDSLHTRVVRDVSGTVVGGSWFQVAPIPGGYTTDGRYDVNGDGAYDHRYSRYSLVASGSAGLDIDVFAVDQELDGAYDLWAHSGALLEHGPSTSSQISAVDLGGNSSIESVVSTSTVFSGQ